MQKLYNKCIRCGKPLKTDENRVRGYGPICYRKVKQRKQNKLIKLETKEFT